MEKIIDLHIHTNLSDGTLTPKEVLDEAKKKGIKYISICDHDTIDAYNKELFNYANKLGITLIPGVEISSRTDKCGIHVLGYNYDIESKEFKEKLQNLRNARHDYLWNVSKKLKEHGYIVNTKELDKIEAITKAHIARDIISNKENEKILIKDFNHLPNMGEFIEGMLNEGCPCYVKKLTVTPKEASEMIKDANGKVILAHPVVYYHEDNISNKEVTNIIKDMNADGIEAYYIYFNKNNKKIDEVSFWVNYAKENNLIMTIGSDFHHDDNMRPLIGLTNHEININEDIITKIINDLKK